MQHPESYSFAESQQASQMPKSNCHQASDTAPKCFAHAIFVLPPLIRHQELPKQQFAPTLFEETQLHNLLSQFYEMRQQKLVN